LCPFGLGRIDFGVPLALWEADFHKMKGRETLRRSHSDFNTTEESMGLTESSSSPSIKLHTEHVGTENFLFLEISLIIFIYPFILLCSIKMHIVNPGIR
jgi:hypothetical protein